MDFIKTLGYKAFDSRLKRISDRMSHDVRKLYKEIDIDIEPNWYLIFMLLQNRGEISIADIAESLGYSHPSVVVIVKKCRKRTIYIYKKIKMINGNNWYHYHPKQQKYYQN